MTQSNLTRRTLITSAPAAAICTSATPDAALALTKLAETEEGQSRILRLFHQYWAILDAACEHVCTTPGKDEDAELERLFYQHSDKIEAEMMALPCTSAADFAAKVIVYTVRGSVYSDWGTGAIWREARALTGIAV